MQNARRFLPLGLILAAAALFVARQFWLPAPFTLELEVKSAPAARLQLLYDKGSGFNSRDSTVRSAGREKRFVRLRFPIAADKLHALRLAEVDHAMRLELRHVTLRSLGGETRALRAEDFRPAENVSYIKQAEERIVIGAVPLQSNLAVEFAPPHPLDATSLASNIDRASVIVLAIACIAFLWLTKAGTAPATGKLSPRAVVAVLTAAYVLAVAADLNGSSSAIWRRLADRQARDAMLVAGSAKDFRSDEWAVHTPWMLAQVHGTPSFTLANANIGPPGAPLLTNLPARHWSMLFRPNFWGFFIFDSERAFAVYWNFKWFGLLLGSFLFLHLITRGDILVSLSGAIFLWASAYTQWWLSSPSLMPEMVALMFFAVWAVALIWRAERRATIAAASVLFFFALLQFVFCSYPRFQIPLAYVAAGLIACGALGERSRSLTRFRLASLAITIAAAAVTLTLWSREVAPLIRDIQTLAYPGQVVSTGGGYSWPQLVAPFFSFGLSEENYPAASMNVVEAAGFLFIAPFVALAVLRDGFHKRADVLVIGCLIMAAGLIVFILVGIPLPLAKWSGWSHVYGARALLPLGIVSAVALCRYLASPLPGIPRARTVELCMFAAGVVALFSLFSAANRILGEFVTQTTLAAAAAFFALFALCVWSRRVLAACLLLVLPLVASYGLTNPIARGLGGFTRSPLHAQIAQLHERAPAAKWLVLGRSVRSHYLAQFVKSTGAPTLGGVRMSPDAEMVRALDPEEKQKTVWNRYAAIAFHPSAAPEPRFELTFLDSYIVHLPVRAEVFDRLGVGYILQVDLPEEASHIPGFQVAASLANVRVLAREDGAGAPGAIPPMP